MVKTFVSAALVALALVATAVPTSAQQIACSARASPGDIVVGIDLVADASCVTGGLGCLGTVCRFCKRKETPASGHLMSCPAPATTSGPSTPTATATPAAECSALLSPGDKAVGIFVYRDTTCAAGGVGCISSVCRYCRAQSTPQSQHLLACSASSQGTPASTSTSASTPLAPSPAASSSMPAVSNVCANLLASGDTSVGISIASDATCSSQGGVGCIAGAACRYCRVLETPQSKHLPLCSAILSPATTEDSAPIQALRASTTADGGNVSATARDDGTSTSRALSVGGLAVAAAVAVAAFAAKRARDRAADDSLVTPTNMIHRNEPLCTL